MSDHDDKHAAYDWVAMIIHYLGKSVEAFVNEVGRSEGRMLIFRYNMVKVAALAVAAIEAIDRKIENDL